MKSSFGAAKNTKLHVLLFGKDRENHVVIIAMKLFVPLKHPVDSIMYAVSRNRSEKADKILIGLEKMMFKRSVGEKRME